VFPLKQICKGQNTTYWEQDNPHVAVDTYHQTNPRITRRCMTHEAVLLGPVLLGGVVNAERYLQFLNDVLEPYMNEMSLTV
jgi:hypothetical protein